jgi:hypothetical protein
MTVVVAGVAAMVMVVVAVLLVRGERVIPGHSSRSRVSCVFFCLFHIHVFS